MTQQKSDEKVEWAPQPVLVGDLRSGNRLVVAHVGDRVVKSKKITTIDECKSLWRTHVHIEGGCYDTRQTVLIAVPK